LHTPRSKHPKTAFIAEINGYKEEDRERLRVLASSELVKHSKGLCKEAEVNQDWDNKVEL